MTDAWVEATLVALLALLSDQEERCLTLDQIGDQVGEAPVTPTQIEQLFIRLEAAGVDISGQRQAVDLPGLLRQVLGAARALKSQGLAADRAAICERTGLSRGAVRVALLYAEVLRG